MQLVFATHNTHKVSEIRRILPSSVILLTADEVGCTEEIPENGVTLEQNARQKAGYVYENYNRNAFADDTGLEVAVLKGEPGVYSARYAGEGKSADDNIEKLLGKLSGCEDRSAVFKTVIAVVIDGQYYLFEGAVHGTITEEKQGENGFGYDPIFMPEGYNRTFAQMTLEEKNTISHRATAVKKFAEFLKKLG